MSGLRERAFLRGTFTAGLAAGLLALSSGCLSFAWTHDHTFRPLRKDALVDLEEGTTPLYVWEYKGDGAAIAWGFGDNDSKRIAWTIPLQRARPTISFGTIDAKLRGAVLLFDRDLVLEEVKQGYLRDLAKELQRKRPAPVEADAPGDEKKP
jgi:hypothetical protein